MRVFFHILLFMICSFSFAQKNKIVIIKKVEDIPRGKFIFTIIDMHTDQLYLGYSKKSPVLDTNQTKNIKGIRNGGHVQVLRHAIDEIKGTRESLLDKLGPKGEGRFIGGGIVVDFENRIRIHPYYSYNAGGLIGDSTFTINPRLKELNELSTTLIPDNLRDYFHTVLQANLQMELKATPSKGSFLGFQAKDTEISNFHSNRSLEPEELQKILDKYKFHLNQTETEPLYNKPKKPFVKKVVTPELKIKKHNTRTAIISCIVNFLRR